MPSEKADVVLSIEVRLGIHWVLSQTAPHLSFSTLRAPAQARFANPMISFKGRHFQKEMIRQSVRWYLAYSLSYRGIEEIMKERGFEVDHSTIQRWVVRYTRQLEEVFHQKKKRPGGRWRLDETYLEGKGQWKYFYRAEDKQGNTIDFLLSAKRDKDKKAARRFLTKPIGRTVKPGLINIDKSGANIAAIQDYNNERIGFVTNRPAGRYIRIC